MNDGKKCFAIPGPFVSSCTLSRIRSNITSCYWAPMPPKKQVQITPTFRRSPLILPPAQTIYRHPWVLKVPISPLCRSLTTIKLANYPTSKSCHSEPHAPVYWCSGWWWTGVIAGQRDPALPFPLQNLQDSERGRRRAYDPSPTTGGFSTSSWAGIAARGLDQTRLPQLGFVCVVERCGSSVTTGGRNTYVTAGLRGLSCLSPATLFVHGRPMAVICDRAQSRWFLRLFMRYGQFNKVHHLDSKIGCQFG